MGTWIINKRYNNCMAPLFPLYPVLIIDDDRTTLDGYRIALDEFGINNFSLCHDSREVMPLLLRNTFSLILLDLRMPYISGQELLEKIKENHAHIPVVIVTAVSDATIAVDCMKKGAFDYICKPVDITRLISIIKHALTIHNLKHEVVTLSRGLLSDECKHPNAFSHIITNNEKMKSIFRYVEAVAGSPKAVLITGESGVGKELIAKAIHICSRRKGKFVSVNIAGLDDTMFSDTLFGHRKGAFTSAEFDRKGLINNAAKGTLFLDEIGSLEYNSQVKLLRLLQENEYYSLGSDNISKINTKIIVATNTDLKQMQKEGTFRKDLYYRLITHHIHLPPLRERKEDLPFLVDYFITHAAQTLQKKKPAVPPELLPLLYSYSFPGNIRELQAIIFDAVSRHRGGILSLTSCKEYIVDHSKSGKNKKEIYVNSEKIINYFGGFPTLKEVEEFFLNEALKNTRGNRSTAALLLGISLSTLSRRLKNK
jgi:DNA-binding NtrC family response regulator